MLLVIFVKSFIIGSIFPSKFAKSLHSTLHPLSLILSAITPFIESIPVKQIIFKSTTVGFLNYLLFYRFFILFLSFVFLLLLNFFLLPNHFTNTILFTIHVFTHVKAFVWPSFFTISMWSSILEIAFIFKSCWIFIDTLPL